MTESQIATVRIVNERPGVSVAVIGASYAEALVAAGMVTVRHGKVYPTAAAKPYQGRSPAQLRNDRADAHALLMGAYAANR